MGTEQKLGPKGQTLKKDPHGDPAGDSAKSCDSQVDRCYTHPTLHSVAYVFNWASVWINPVIYIGAQKKYQVTTVIPAAIIGVN